MEEKNQPNSRYRRRRQQRKKKSHGCLIFMVIAILLTALAGYGVYLYFFGGDEAAKQKPASQQTTEQQGKDNNKNGVQQANHVTDIEKHGGQTANKKYGDLFGNAKYLIHIHKQAYRLELYEKNQDEPVRTYGIAVAKNSGDKQRTGDNRTPTSWGKAVDIPKSYKGAKVGVASKEVPFRVEEVCDASDWTHDFRDGKGVIQGAYGPWFISLDTGWDGIGIHGTHDPASIGTMASEGCIRLKNSDVAELKKIIYKDNKGVGTRVIITEE